MRNRIGSGLGLLLAAVLVLVLVLVLVGQAGPVGAVGEPPNTTVTRQLTSTLYPATAISNGTTVYSGAAVSSRWNSADVFVAVDLTGTAFLTVTVQLSPDGINWADADYEYATDSAIATQSYVRSLSADGVEYMRVPLAGERMRVKIASSGAVTPTVMATYRN